MTTQLFLVLSSTRGSSNVDSALRLFRLSSNERLRLYPRTASDAADIKNFVDIFRDFPQVLETAIGFFQWATHSKILKSNVVVILGFKEIPVRKMKIMPGDMADGEPTVDSMKYLGIEVLNNYNRVCL